MNIKGRRQSKNVVDTTNLDAGSIRDAMPSNRPLPPIPQRVSDDMERVAMRRNAKAFMSKKMDRLFPKGK